MPPVKTETLRVMTGLELSRRRVAGSRWNPAMEEAEESGGGDEADEDVWWEVERGMRAVWEGKFLSLSLA